MKNISKKWKRILPAVLLVLALALLSGCGGEAKPAGDTMVYGSQDYTAINPALYEHGEINLLIFAGLTAHDADNNVVPGLAEKWSYDKGAKTWTFRLRKDLTFHDGEPLTSADVKFTLESILDEKNGSEIVSNYADIKKISCPDARTVKIQLKEENVGFPEYMTIGILPKHLLEGKDLTTDEFNQKPVGAGPYKLTEWDEGQSITLERFDGYYAGKANIPKIIFKIVPDSATRLLQLESGDLDMAQLTPKDGKALMKKDSDCSVYEMDTADYRAIAYNFAGSKLFKKYPELANILSYGIDRQAILKSVLLGEGGSGGALALAVGNRVAMQEHAVYSVLSPEGFASILWKDRTRAPEAAEAMRMDAASVLECGIIDAVISEGEGPAHENPEEAVAAVRDYVRAAYKELADLAPDELVRQRQERFAKF